MSNSNINEREQAAVGRARELMVEALESELEELDKEHSDGDGPDFDDMEGIAVLSAAISLSRVGFNDPAAALRQFGIPSA